LTAAGSAGSTGVMSPEFDHQPTATKENIEQSQFWAGEIGWALIHDPADRNMDLVPDRFKIDFGCPVCGAAWGELLAAGYTSSRVSGGRARWDGVGMVIESGPTAPLDFRAARITCVSGHTFNYDSYTRRIQRYAHPSWASAALLGGVAVMAMAGYLLSGVFRKGKL